MFVELGVARGLGQELVERREATDSLSDLSGAAHDQVDTLSERSSRWRHSAEMMGLANGHVLEEREHELLLAAEVVPDAGLVDLGLG